MTSELALSIGDSYLDSWIPLNPHSEMKKDKIIHVNAFIQFHLVKVLFSDDLPAIIQLDYSEWFQNVHFRLILEKLTGLLHLDPYFRPNLLDLAGLLHLDSYFRPILLDLIVIFYVIYNVSDKWFYSQKIIAEGSFIGRFQLK